MYWIALLTGVEPLVFATGAALAFYVPGAVLVQLNPGMFGQTTWVERTALSLVSSVTFVAMSAFILDFTPLGITRPTLAGAITTLVLAAVLVEATKGSQWSGPSTTRFGVELAAVAFMALAWVAVMPVVGRLADLVDRSITPRPPNGYSIFTASCLQLPGRERRSSVEFAVGDRHDLHDSYHLIVTRDGRRIVSTALPHSLGTVNMVRYQVNVAHGWHRVMGQLEGRADKGTSTTTLMTTVVPASCRGR